VRRLLFGFALLAGPVALAADLPGVLVSRQLAEARGLAPGDEIALSADPAGAGARRFRIVAVYEPTPDPMQLTAERHELRLHLPDMLALLGRDDPQGRETVDAINIRLADPATADEVVREIEQRLPDITVESATRPRPGDPFAVLDRFHLAIAIVTLLGSSAFLLALMVMRAEERREIVGILRLIGLTRGRILLEVVVEGAIIAAAGAVFGVLLALGLQQAANAFFQWYYDTPLVFVRISAGIAGRSIALALPLGIVAGVVASWALLRREITQLVRR